MRGGGGFTWEGVWVSLFWNLEGLSNEMVSSARALEMSPGRQSVGGGTGQGPGFTVAQGPRVPGGWGLLPTPSWPLPEPGLTSLLCNPE